MSTAVEPAIKPKKKTSYLTNKQLLPEVKLCKEQGKMSDKLAMMLQLLCARYAKKANWVNYTYNEDMQAYAMLMLVRTWNSFNPEKSSNPFAFFTQCIKHSFIQFLNQEKKHRNIRDLLLVDQGMNPSYGFSDDGDAHIVEDEEDFHANKRVAEQLAEQASGVDSEGGNEDDHSSDYVTANPT